MKYGWTKLLVGKMKDNKKLSVILELAGEK